MPDSRPPRVFISYSHKDRVWLERLQVFLKPLERDNGVERWDDSKIVAGSSWKEEIKAAIEGASVAILLISQDFLSSDFIAKDELPPLLEAAESRGLVVLSVILKPSLFEHTHSLSRFQAVNNPGRPLVNLTTGQREAEWVRVIAAVKAALARTAGPASAPPAAEVPADPLTAAAQPSRRPDPVILNPIDGAEMILIPAGEFTMGTSDTEIESLLRENPDWKREWFENEKPQRRVHLDAYRVYKNPVTVEQFRRFCAATTREMPPAPSWGWNDDHPVVNVTWEDAAAYARWAGAALPTEAQWEKAARGTDGRRYPWGNDWDAAKCRCSRKTAGDAKSTAPVGLYPQGASPHGELDMAGNVWEWCADWYQEDYYRKSPKSNPQGPSKGDVRILRGGSWYNYGPVGFRAANRSRFGPEYGDYDIGFRCVAREDSR